jgi:hypothetical protein
LADDVAAHQTQLYGLAMTNFKKCFAVFTVLFWMTAMSSMAASSAASSASDSVSTSVGSLSDSVKKSSDSSSKATGVAEGDYTIIDVAAIPERPGTARLKLQALADQGEDSEFFLYLPQQVVDQSHLAQGQIVTARQRPYGVEFISGETRQAFFLVLSDAWYRELQTRAVVL